MTERRSDKWFGVALSVVVHATLAGLFVWGFWFYGKPKQAPPPQLAIEATVVDPNSLPANTFPRSTPEAPAPLPEPEPEPAPEAPAAEPVPEPEPEPPPPDDSAQRERERQEQERQEQERVERERAEQQRIAQERIAKEKAAQEKAVADKAAADKAARDKAAEEKVRQEAERLAKEKATRDRAEKERADREAAEKERQRQADDRLRQQRETELRNQLAAEERANAMRNSSAMQNYVAMIAARIERAWIRPPSARQGLNCQVRVSQLASGEVTGVSVLACNGDEAVRQSIEAAVYRASPLPVAPDPALFDRNLVFNFRPEE